MLGAVNNRSARVYTIFPRDYIEIYFDFVHDHARQMAEEGIVAYGLRGFGAELFVEFNYTFRAPEYGLHESVTQRYRIALTTEVFSFAQTGTPTFEWQRNLNVRSVYLTLPGVMMFILFFGVSIVGLLHNIRRLTENLNPAKAEAEAIIKKYNNEIVIYDKPVNMARYEQRAVQEFDELVKLVINLNKHIMCFKDENRAEFVVIIDDFACCYEVVFEGDLIDKSEKDACAEDLVENVK